VFQTNFSFTFLLFLYHSNETFDSFCNPICPQALRRFLAVQLHNLVYYRIFRANKVGLMLSYKYIHHTIIEARDIHTDELMFYLIKNKGEETWFRLNPYNVW
jgi:hypothetical protein